MSHAACLPLKSLGRGVRFRNITSVVSSQLPVISSSNGYGPACGPLLLHRLKAGGASPRQLLTVESSNSKLARRLNLRSEAFVHVAQASVFDNDRSSAGGFAGGCCGGRDALCERHSMVERQHGAAFFGGISRRPDPDQGQLCGQY